MSRPFLLFVFTLLAGWAAAQQDSGMIVKKNRNFTLDVLTGYSLPFGNYARVDTNNKLSGYANGGFFVQVTGSFIGKGNLGIAFSYCFQYNALDKSAQNVTPDGHQYQLGSTAWNNHYLLAGPVYQNTFGKFFLAVRLQGGVVVSRSSNFYITMPPPDTVSPPYLSQGVGAGVAVQGMIVAGYSISHKVTLTAHINYTGANPSRKKDYYWAHFYVDEHGDPHYVFEGGEFQMKKKISTFNIGLGISFRL
ncbi:MAG: hypothetical protein D4R67_06325 [Bacteroidetes bacterium]|nr:MAG: hypothetical protein D4R67_06325 [Bacteroidota bacterium]